MQEVLRDVVELVNSEHGDTAPMGPVCCAVGTLHDERT